MFLLRWALYSWLVLFHYDRCSKISNITWLPKKHAQTVLFDLILYVQSTIFHLCKDGSSWAEPVLARMNVSCSRTQRSDAGEAWTRGPSVSSQALYHWATALPLHKQCRPRSDCFWSSILIRIFPVCYSDKNLIIHALMTSILFA